MSLVIARIQMSEENRSYSFKKNIFKKHEKKKLLKHFPRQPEKLFFYDIYKQDKIQNVINFILNSSIQNFTSQSQLMKSNSNRKSIPLHKKNELVINKNLVQNVFSTSLNENMQTYLEIEKEKLKNLDSNVAKKIVATAEKNLLKFVHSKNKVSCMNISETYKPFMTMQFSTKTRMKCDLFDKKKLQAELQKQKYTKNNFSFARPLAQNTFRIIYKQLQDLKNLKQTRKSEQNADQNSVGAYCGLSNKRKKKTMLFY